MINTDKFLVTVIGSQNTGKSTFIKDVINKYKDNPIYEPFYTPEMDYRKVIESKGLKINREGNYESQRAILDCLVDGTIEAIRNPEWKNVIFDRCPIDNIVYSLYLRGQDKISGENIKQMISEMKRFVRLYDAIIYIPLDHCEDIEVVDDKFRDTDLNYRTYVDHLFQKVISDLDEIDRDKIVEIYGTRNDRLAMFFEELNHKFVVKNQWQTSF